MEFYTECVEYEVEVDGDEHGVDYRALDTCALTLYMRSKLKASLAKDQFHANFGNAWKRRMHVSRRNMSTLRYNERVVIQFKLQ